MNYKSDYSIDTHALIWFVEGRSTLSDPAREIIKEIFSGKYLASISVMCYVEAFHNSLKRKEFIFSKFLNELKRPNILKIPLEDEVLKLCYKLPKQLEIHDRIIAATAKLTDSVLITKDPILRKVLWLKTLW